MNKFKKVLFGSVVLSSFLFIGNYSALTVKPTCPGSATAGSTISVDVVATRASGDPKISAIEGKLTSSDALSLTSSENSSDWAELSKMPRFSVGNLSYDKLMSTTSKTLYNLKFKVSGSASGNLNVNIGGVVATNETGGIVSSVSGGSCSVKILSSVNTLSSLSVSGIDFNFSSGVTTYNLSTDLSRVTISAVKTDSSASVSGVGSKNLAYGKNIFKVVVKSESGASRTYTLNITRNDNRSNVNTLKSLSLSEGSIDFSPSKTSYIVNLKANTKSVRIDASLTDSKSSFVSGYGPRTVNLAGGNNVFYVKVKAESGAVKIYTLSINVEDGRSKVNTLRSLSLSEGSIDFSPSKINYVVNLKANTKSVRIDASLTDSKSSFVSGYGPRTVNLAGGNNVFYVKVKAENGALKTYTLSINVEDGRSKNAYLKSITIKDYPINFDKNIVRYKISVPNDVTKLDVSAVSEDSKAKVNINNPTLKVGSNMISIEVKAENGTLKVYEVEVERLKEAGDLSTNNYLSGLKVEGYSLSFDKDTTDYSLVVKNTKDLKVIATPVDPKARITIVGDKNIKDGRVINIAVSAENGSVRQYNIRIQVKSNKLVYILLGVLGGLVALVVLVVVIIKIKKGKDPTNLISANKLSK